MNGYVFQIVVKTENQLNNDDLSIILRDFHARLQGYYTECPEQLKGANVEIKGVKK